MDKKVNHVEYIKRALIDTNIIDTEDATTIATKLNAKLSVIEHYDIWLFRREIGQSLKKFIIDTCKDIPTTKLDDTIESITNHIIGGVKTDPPQITRDSHMVWHSLAGRIGNQVDKPLPSFVGRMTPISAPVFPVGEAEVMSAPIFPVGRNVAMSAPIFPVGRMTPISAPVFPTGRSVVVSAPIFNNSLLAKAVPTTIEEITQWTCSICTLINESNKHACDACGYPRE